MTAGPMVRKAILLVHVASSVGLIGAVATFLVLAIAGIEGSTSVYFGMRLIAWTLIIPLTVTSLLVGLVSALTTPWGLVRYYWVIAKLVLTIFALVVLLLQTGRINSLAEGPIGPASIEAQTAMVVHSGGGLVVLLIIAVLSIYKPRGLTGWGQRSLA